MAYEEILKSISLDADASLAGYTGVSGTPGAADPHYGKAMFRFVKITGVNKVGRVSANTDAVIGVCQNKPQVEGQAATVAIFGVSMMIAGGAITAGDAITSDGEGRAVDAAGGGDVFGVALGEAAAAGHLLPVLLQVQ